MGKNYIQKKIYYHDTDAGGVVYYANYLRHLEEARHEYCLSKGVNIPEYAEKGVLFPVAHLEIDYKAPARYSDIIHIFTDIEKTGFSSVHFLQEIKRGKTAIVLARIVCACVNSGLKPIAMPDKVRQALGTGEKK